MKLKTPSDLRELPVGAVFVSDEDCLWSGRYAGIRWRKLDNLTIECLDKEDGFGFRRDSTVSYLPSFLDPLPATLEQTNES